MEANEKRRNVDDMCGQIILQTKRIDDLVKEGTNNPKWMIEEQCKKLKTFLDRGEALGNELVNTCNSINQNVQLAILFAPDQQTLKKYKELSTTMLDIVEKHSTLFSYLSHKHIGYLSRIPEPLDVPPAAHKPAETTVWK